MLDMDDVYHECLSKRNQKAAEVLEQQQMDGREEAAWNDNELRKRRPTSAMDPAGRQWTIAKAMAID
jgi:hypothetical protein